MFMDDAREWNGVEERSSPERLLLFLNNSSVKALSPPILGTRENTDEDADRTTGRDLLKGETNVDGRRSIAFLVVESCSSRASDAVA